MLGKSLRYVLWLSFIVLSGTAFANEPAARDNECNAALQSDYKPGRGTLDYYQALAAKAEKTIGQPPITPSFVNPTIEMQLASKMWRGVEGPRLFQEMLPDGCRFIAHKLLGSAGDGVVKDAGSGEFVMLRCEVEWHGKNIGFNISVPVSTLVANIGRSERWLVGPEVEALLDWGHGGGTKTTGNHTSIGIMNHMAKYGVAVIAIDQPWHGEGPRTFFSDDLDYWAFRKAILGKFVHPSVGRNTIGLGHSMGGIFADMMMRRSDNQHLNLRSRYKAFIALSSVVDLMPGKDFRAKTQAEQWKEAENKQAHLAHRIAPGDRDLGTALLESDKISALSGVFINFMNMFHDWTIPAHQGADYLPTTFIWGDSDYLYVGNEDLIDNYLLKLKNVKLKVFGPRVNFKGDVLQVGHLIFDHYRTQKDHPAALDLITEYLRQKEVPFANVEQARMAFFTRFVASHVSKHFWLNEDNRGYEALVMAAYFWDPDFKAFAIQQMKETKVYQDAFNKSKDRKFAERNAERAYMLQFINKDMPETYTLIREEVERVIGKKLEARRRDSTTALIANLLQAYSANLAFRQYAQSVDVYIEKVTPEFQKLNEKAETIRQYSLSTEWLNQAMREIEQARLSGREPNKKWSESNVKRNIETRDVALAKLANEYGIDAANSQLLKDETEKIAALRRRQYVPKGLLASIAEQNVKDRDRLSLEIQSLRKEKEALRDQLEKLTKERNQLDADLADLVPVKTVEVEKALDELVVADERVRLSVEAYMIELNQTQNLSRDLMRRLPKHLQEIFDAYEAASKHYQATVAHARRAAHERAATGGFGEAAKNIMAELVALRAEILKTSRAVNEVDSKIHTRKQMNDRLTQDYFNRLVPGYIHVERKKLIDLFALPATEWESIRGSLEIIWGDWKNLWKERPADDKVELY